MVAWVFVVAWSALQVTAGAGPEPPSSAASADMPVERVTTVLERPTLQGVRFDNRVYFKEETLRGKMRSTLGDPVDLSLLQEDAANFRADYRARGYLHAAVTVSVVMGDNASQQIAVFAIDAGPQAELRSVRIVGNQLVSESALREGLFSRPPEVFGALTRAGVFHRPFVDQDVQRITANYYKRGFLEAKVTDIRVLADPALNTIEVTFAVSEGPQYELIAIDISDEDNLVTTQGSAVAVGRERITVADGDIADLVAIQTQADGLLDDLREQGHALARLDLQVAVATAPSKRDDRRGLRVTIKRIAGPIAIVRNVVISGTHSTQEHVWQRDMVMQTGEVYRHSLVKRSEAQLMQTGLLVQAAGKAIPVPAKELAPPGPGQAFIDIDMNVQQTPVTWVISPAGIIDPNEGFVFVGLLGDRNLLGTGIAAFFSLQWSQLRLLFDLTITEPRLLDSRLALTGELHRRSLVYRDFNIESDLGGSMRLSQSFPLGFDLGGQAFLGVSGGAGIERAGVRFRDNSSKPSTALLPVGVLRNTLDAAVSFDSRSGGLAAKNGVLASINATAAGSYTFSGVSFVDAGANLRLYWTPFWDVTLRSSTTAGLVVDPFGGDVPVTDRYFLGGVGSVRGYFPRSIASERRAADGNLLVGGTSRLQQSVELDVPMWPQSPIRLFGFFDAGNVFDGKAAADAVTPLLFTSVGGGIRIDNGALPLRFEWSFPLNRRGIDQPVNFFIGVGSSI